MARWLSVSALVLFSAFLQCSPLARWAMWWREDLAAGQIWRLVSAHFTHTNWAHWAMNMLALAIIVFFFQCSARALWLLSLILSVWIGVGLWFTDLQGYVGFSGILHGLFVYFSLQEWVLGRKSSLWLALAVSIKVVWETIFGASDSTQMLINAPVAIVAHQLGFLGGVLAVLPELFKKKVLHC